MPTPGPLPMFYCRLRMTWYITALDLTKGYWQVPLRPQDKPQTAFATPKGLFHFKVMLFGLHGAAATFQRLVDTVLGTCQDFVLAYLADILIYSCDWEQHLSHIARVFQLLLEAGLRVNPTKSKIGFTQLEYLGYTIGEGTVRPQAKKIEAIQNVPRHTSKKQLRQFLGLTGYYSRFIPRFAELALPLTDHLQKHQPDVIHLDLETSRALSHLKEALCNAPVLRTSPYKPMHPRGPSGRFCPTYHDGEHPVVYLSRKLHPAECRYSTEREILAMKWAIETLQY